MRSYCTTNPAGRIVERSEYAEATEKNTRRVRLSPEIHAARQQIVEHIFGTINLRRKINILGVESAKQWGKKTLFSIFSAVTLLKARQWIEEEYFFFSYRRTYTAE